MSRRRQAFRMTKPMIERMLKKILEKLDDLRLDYSPDRLYRIVDNFWIAVSRKAYRKRLRKAIKNNREPDYDYISRDIEEHLYDTLIECIPTYIWRWYHTKFESRKEHDEVLYNMLWLSKIARRVHWDLFDERRMLTKETKYQEECKKELFSNLEKHIDLLWW